MVSFDAAGKWWNMNTSTPRIEGCDQENGRRRYLAIERSEVFFTADPTMVDYSKKIFPEDGELIQFLCSGEAAVVYMRNFFHPFVMRRSAEECRNILLNPPEEISNATTRLMSRFQEKSADDDAESYQDAPFSAAAVSAARSFHSYFSGPKVTKWAAMWERRIPGLSVPEGRHRKNVRPSRYTALCRAASAAPWLWALKDDGSLRRLNLNLELYEQNVVRNPHIAALGARGEFLLRDAWVTRGEAAPPSTGSADQIIGIDTEKPAGALYEFVNLQGLSDFGANAPSGDEERELATKYLERARDFGMPLEGAEKLMVRNPESFAKIMVSYFRPHGLPGRMYASGPSVQNISRSAREAS